MTCTSKLGSVVTRTPRTCTELLGSTKTVHVPGDTEVTGINVGSSTKEEIWGSTSTCEPGVEGRTTGREGGLGGVRVEKGNSVNSV